MMAPNSPADKRERKTGMPLSRIKKIMKCSGEVDYVSTDGASLMVQATEMFLVSLTQQAFKNAKNLHDIDYNDVANVICNTEKYSFLTEMVPKKITVREYFQLMKQKEKDEMEENDNNDNNQASNFKDN